MEDTGSLPYAGLPHGSADAVVRASGTLSRSLRIRCILGAAVLTGGILAAAGNAWFNDVALPPSGADAASISRAVRSSLGRNAGFSDLRVAVRGSYALVSVTFNWASYATFERDARGWHRLVESDWIEYPNKFAFWRAGVPFWTANALVNGIRRERRMGPDLLFFNEGC